MKNKILWVELCRIAAMFAVVLLHVSAYSIQKSKFHDLQWSIALAYDSLARWCVPVFLMLTGYLAALGSEVDGDVISLVRKRVRRIIPALLFWSFFYVIIAGFKNHLLGKSIFSGVGFALLSGEPYYHMWYLYMLLPMFFIIPYAIKLFERLSKREAFFLIMFTTSMSAFFSIYRWLFFPVITVPFVLNAVLYLPFIFAGFFLAKFHCHLSIRWASAIFAVSFVAIYCGYYYSPSEFTPISRGYFFDNFSVPVLLMSFSAFVIVRGFGSLSFAVNKSLFLVSSVSLGVYMVHPFFIDLIFNFFINPATYNQLWFIPVTTLLITLFSIIVCVIMAKLDTFRKFVI